MAYVKIIRLVFQLPKVHKLLLHISLRHPSSTLLQTPLHLIGSLASAGAAMKIFGWMHHKIHLRRSYRLLSHENGILKENLKSKNIDLEAGSLEKDTHALLGTNNSEAQVLILENLDGWEEGILAIGTFGLHQLQPYQSDSETAMNEDHVVLGKEDHEELVDEAQEGIVKNFEETLPNSMDVEIMESHSFHCGEITELSDLNIEEEKGSNERRTTLADLFHAEGNNDCVIGKAQILCQNNDLTMSMETIKEKEEEKKKKKKQKHGRSLAKKLMPWKGEEAKQTPKLQRFITRMLRKKIHPELGDDLYGEVPEEELNDICKFSGKLDLNEHINAEGKHEYSAAMHRTEVAATSSTSQ